MSEGELALAIFNALKAQGEYVNNHDDSGVSDVCLDGWFDLEEVAAYIMEELNK